ncbi:MAG TPA: hypothetical protein VOA80_04710 [Thermoanaerobaculia bacterium]|nr:hypothetical protein [Thermoanaerobaculia bacterium]
MTGPNATWREVIEADEQALFEAFAREITTQQKEIAQQTNRAPLRGLHAKLHAGLMAEFQVLADLPPHARCGVFSEPQIFPAVVRFSNGEPAPHPDRHPEPRGIAIKLIGVPGRKLLPGQEDAVTQDFLATSHSVTSTVRNARQFIAFIRASHNRVTLPFALARAVGILESIRILTALVRTVLLSKVRSMATEHYSGTAPIKFGPYAVKFTVQPADGTEATTSSPPKDDVNFLRDDLADRLRKGALVFDFLVQFYVDETRTPIEDTSVPWKPSDAPLVKVAQVRIPSCNLDDPGTSALSEKVERLSFTPWHTTDDHRPLGNVMRARRVAYQASSAFRGHSPEPGRLPL